MKKFGLVGYPLGHSFSKGYFQQKFQTENILDCQYDNYSIETLTQIPANLSGFNVTIPHKQNIMPLLKSIDDAAVQIGAVNCVDVNLRGYNTDAIGFEQSLLAMIGEQRPRALVFGTGGASRAVVYVLKRLSIEYIHISRSGQTRYDNLSAETIKSHKLIINTTPLGMYPKTDAAPEIDYNLIGEGHYLYDLVYNPAETKFLREGRVRGAWVKNGLEMLYLQADAAWKIWNSKF